MKIEKEYQPDDSEAIRLLDKLIKERQEHFLHALSESVESSLLSHLKNDIDFLTEKRNEISERVLKANIGEHN